MTQMPMRHGLLNLLAIKFAAFFYHYYFFYVLFIVFFFGGGGGWGAFIGLSCKILVFFVLLLFVFLYRKGVIGHKGQIM